MAFTRHELQKLAVDYCSAWNSGSAAAVASFFACDGGIVINNGDPWQGRDRVMAMAEGFFADVPDLCLTCDDIRGSGAHALLVWTFTGHDAASGRALFIHGWEEWDLGPDMKVTQSRGWFDAEDYGRQAGG